MNRPSQSRSFACPSSVSRPTHRKLNTSARRRLLLEQLEGRRLLAATPFSEDFSAFLGTGLVAAPTNGELNSNDYRVTGMSDGDSAFGGSFTTGDFARGTSPGGISTGGLYAFDIGSGNIALGVQPGASDFTPGAITIKIDNASGVAADTWSVNFNVVSYNDQPRSNTYELYVSIDDINYDLVPGSTFISPEAADSTPTWQTTNFDLTINLPAAVTDGDPIYLQWRGDDTSGSGSRDEVGIDDFQVDVAGAPPANFTLQLLHASDLEGGVDAISRAANFAALVDHFEQDTANFDGSILLSAGDNYIGGPFFSAAADASLRTPLQQAYQTLFNEPGLTNIREGNGTVDLTIMNILGVDASAIGNHEFDFGSDQFELLIEEDIRGANLSDVRWLGAQFPYLSSNLDFSGDSELGNLFTSDILPNTAFQADLGDLPATQSLPKLAQATKILSGGEWIGVVGATTQLIEAISSPTGTVETTGGVNDMPALAAALQPIINDLLDGDDNVPGNADDLDKIVLVSHLQQISLEETLIQLLSGVDIVIAGGSDTLLADGNDSLRPGDVADGNYPLLTTNLDSDPALIVSTDGEYSYLGRLVVEFDSNGVLVPGSVNDILSGAFSTADSDVLATIGGATIEDVIAASQKATEVKKLTDAVGTVVAAKDGNVLGLTGVFLEGNRDKVRTEETNFGNLSADANLAFARLIDPTTTVSIKNGGGIRAAIGEVDNLTGELLPPQGNNAIGKTVGEVSQLDVENSLRFNNGLSLLTLTLDELARTLEHGVAASAPGATPGQFPQVSGVRFSFDTNLPSGQRIRNLALTDELGNVTKVVIQDGVFIADANESIRIVTLNFLADGGDNYPLSAFGDQRLDLTNPAVGAPTGASTFAIAGSEQDALAEYMIASHSTLPYYTRDTANVLDRRIVNLTVPGAVDTVTSDVPSGEITLTNLGSITLAGAEISSYDPGTGLAFVTFGGGVQVVDLNNPASPSLVGTIVPSNDVPGSSDSVTSVAVNIAGVLAVAVPNANKTDNGNVFFYDVTAGAGGITFLEAVEVGALPDMVTYDPTGAMLLVANEGESAGADNEPDVLPNPDGSVSIISMATVGSGSTLATSLSFTGLNNPTDLAALRTKGVRITELALGADTNNPQVSADIEPEYIAVEGVTAYITLQENNAVAVIQDITAPANFTVADILPLGLKDHSLPFNKLDPSNQDGGIHIANFPVYGMYMPDAIDTFNVNGNAYFVTANEGDSRGIDEQRIRGYNGAGAPTADGAAASLLDADVFASLQANALLGRLISSPFDGDTDNDGDVERLQVLGGRSFSIFDAAGNIVFDSGDLFERVTAAMTPTYFNANNGSPADFDSRSDDKGPEPESVTIAHIGSETYALVGLERSAGGIMIFNVSEPTDVQFVGYTYIEGDISPEGLLFVPNGPTGTPLVLVAHEVSNNLRVYGVNVAAPELNTVLVNHGRSDQRSVVTEVVVNFTQPVDLLANPFALTNTTTGLSVDLTNATITPLSDRSFSLRFGNGASEGGTSIDPRINGGNSLADGAYRLDVFANKVISQLDGATEMETDASYGTQASDNFFRLFGDADGNRTVNFADFLGFRAAYGSSAGSPGYNSIFDFDGDGDILFDDFLRFRSRYGKSV